MTNNESGPLHFVLPGCLLFYLVYSPFCVLILSQVKQYLWSCAMYTKLPSCQRSKYYENNSKLSGHTQTSCYCRDYLLPLLDRKCWIRWFQKNFVIWWVQKQKLWGFVWIFMLASDRLHTGVYFVTGTGDAVSMQEKAGSWDILF